MRRILKVLAVVVAFQAALYVAGLLAKAVLRRQAPGAPDPLADEFDLLNIMEGTDFASRATALRAGTVKNAMGGVELDLTGATLAPGGAYLQVLTVMGGTEVTVPRGWRVIVRGSAMAGAHDLDVTPEDDLDENSPTLTIDATTVAGGLEVSAAPSPVPA